MTMILPEDPRRLNPQPTLYPKRFFPSIGCSSSERLRRLKAHASAARGFGSPETADRLP
jgi:hypothetical protein